MSKIIPINITTTEQAVTLDATYQFAWFRNMGENDCLLSDHSGIVAGGDDVMTVKAGESGRISTSGRAVYIKAVSGTSTGEIHAQNFSDAPFKSKAKGGGQSITVEPLTVNNNGVYTAPTGKAYTPVSVDVQEQPWQPLEDGYSNFWFELTDDTLSPWLNFSAKTENAVIDWGDGSGEQALTTLTPTHTYAKAGRYVVKVKGVTGIARQNSVPYSQYANTLKYAELNTDVDSTVAYTFYMCNGIKKISLSTALTLINSNMFQYASQLLSINIPTGVTAINGGAFTNCLSLESVILPNTVDTLGGNVFNNCLTLPAITLPSAVTNIGSSTFNGCVSLSEIHMQATVPPTLGNNVFNALPTNWLCYVPVGKAETYKAANGWSTYADHILEEGQTPNRMMLAKFTKTEESEVKEDELYKDENR